MVVWGGRDGKPNIKQASDKNLFYRHEDMNAATIHIPMCNQKGR
jgi:hypothetical protein